MLSKYLPKKLYNAAADEDGTDLTALSGLANERLDVLEDWVGDYAAPAKGSESDIATDLKKVYADVETDETGLLARAGVLEAAVGTYSGENDIAGDLQTVFNDVEADETGLLARATALETMIGDYTPEDTDLATDLAKVYGDVETAGTGLLARAAALEAREIRNIYDSETGLLARAAALEAVAPTTGAPITAQVSATAITSDGNDDEITWTAVANGEDGNGISIDITLSAEANGIDITVDGKAIAVDVKTGQGTTATDVLTAVNAHETAGLLVQGELTGLGDAITADSVVTDGGVDITAGLAGAIRYEADKIWISVGESTASVSNWKYAALL